MNDLISRTDAIEAVCEWMQKEFGFLDLNRAERLIDALSALPSAESVQGWIPCSERLPKVDEEVLVTMEWGDVQIAWYDKFGKWETDEWYDLDDILAWMPLPTPYEGGDE